MATTVISLFNEHGIRLPYDGLRAKVGDPNWGFRFSAPQFFGHTRFGQALEQFRKFLPEGAKLLTLADFYNRFMAIIETISARAEVAGILNGPCLPLVFAANKINRENLGEYLENVILAGVKAAYESRFEGRPFNNYRKGDLAGKVDYVPESHLNLLLEAMTNGPFVAAYFPEALRAWSTLACREQMATLPQDLSFVLPDAITHGFAIIGYPDVMARDCHVPGNLGAANTWQSSECSLCFWADDDDLSFDYAGGLADARDACSGGLLLLG